MGDLDRIVDVQISRETQSVTRAAFGIHGILTEFNTDKTTVAFGRFREYVDLDALSDDGWGVYDPVYRAAQKVFSQNPKIEKVMVGRRDSGDASWADALAAIQAASQDWYTFDIVDGTSNLVTFAADFVTGNSIVATVNGVVVTAVPWNTNQQTTMGDLETQIEADVTGATVTVGGAPYRTMTIEIANNGANEHVVASFAITGGASQTTYTAVESTKIVEQDIKDVAAWAETQKKLFSYNSSDSDIPNAGVTDDIASFLKGQNYDRTFGFYYKDSDLSYIEAAACGEALPYDPGSQTWAYKTYAGVTANSFTSLEVAAIEGKNINYYSTIAGNDIGLVGNVASGEWIDVMRGLDWVQARLQEDIFAQLIALRKIPYTDEGISVISGIVEAVLNEAAANGILVLESIVVTAPQVADVDATDKGNRLLPDIEFTATLQGAIHKTQIRGVVTV